MKILIIVIKYNSNKKKADYTYHIPVGLVYIASFLKSNGYEVECLNLNHCNNEEIDISIKEALRKGKFDAVITGGLSVHYLAIKDCVDSVRRHDPGAVIVLGGGLISSQPELMLQNLKPDYAVIGEGEITLLELLRCLGRKGDIDEVAGVGYISKTTSPVVTMPRKAINDIDSLPFPDYEILGFDSYLDNMRSSDSYYFDLFDFPRAYPLISSRSCPFSCTFCFHPIGNKYRQRSIANIMEELNHAVKRYRINVINIFDELFASDRARAYEFCKEITKLQQTLDWELKWNCQMRVDKLDEEFLQTMRNAGCYIISLGLESYSHTVLRSMKKGIAPQQIDKALQTARRLNITIQGNFIFGDIAETTETAHETLNYWRENGNFGGGISLNFIQSYPGTAIYKHCLRKGVIKDEIDFISNHMLKPLNMTEAMTDEEFRRLEADVYEASMKYNRYIKPLRVSVVSGRYEIDVSCPYCNKTSTYRNYYFPDGLKGYSSYYVRDICCRNCRMRFFIATPAVKIELMLIKLIGAKNTFYLKKLARDLYIRIRKYM